jgi:dienelactone hydrolase
VRRRDRLTAAFVVLAFAGVAAAVACSAGAQAAPPTGFFHNGDVKLSYRLTRPPGQGPFPAVVIGHGSGEMRKEMCRHLAIHFERHGFVTLCYDKRGVGDSTGAYSMVGVGNSDDMFATLASDMVAGMRFLREQPDVDRRRVGLAGVSQAGWIIPIAARNGDAAFMVIASGPTVSVGQEIYFSRFADGTTTPIEDAYATLDAFKGPHGFDPRPTLESLNVRGLWLLGGADRSIPIRHTLQVLDRLIAAGRPFEHVVYDGADHSLRSANIGPALETFLTRLPGR